MLFSVSELRQMRVDVQRTNEELDRVFGDILADVVRDLDAAIELDDALCRHLADSLGHTIASLDAVRQKLMRS
jgi:hypothetical protein